MPTAFKILITDSLKQGFYMTATLLSLRRTVVDLPRDQPTAYADAYWAAYGALVLHKSPADRSRMLRLLEMGPEGALAAASLIFHRAFDGESFQIHSSRAGMVSIACIFDRRYRQIIGPCRANCDGHALLAAIIERGLIGEAQQQRRA